MLNSRLHHHLAAFVAGVTVLFLCISAQAQAKKPTVADTLRELDEDIRLEKGMLARRLSTPARLAIAHMHRGQFLTIIVARPSEALKDLDEASKLFRIAIDGGKSVEDSLAETCIFRGLALVSLKKSDEARDSFTKAIRLYEKLISKPDHEHLEPPLAWAYQNRGKVLLKQKNSSGKAATDFDRAIAILSPWVKKKGYEYFQKTIDKLVSLRKEADSLNTKREVSLKGERDTKLQAQHHTRKPPIDNFNKACDVDPHLLAKVQNMA